MPTTLTVSDKSSGIGGLARIPGATISAEQMRASRAICIAFPTEGQLYARDSRFVRSRLLSDHFQVRKERTIKPKAMNLVEVIETNRGSRRFLMDALPIVCDCYSGPDATRTSRACLVVLRLEPYTVSVCFEVDSAPIGETSLLGVPIAIVQTCAPEHAKGKLTCSIRVWGSARRVPRKSDGYASTPCLARRLKRLIEAGRPARRSDVRFNRKLRPRPSADGRRLFREACRIDGVALPRAPAAYRRPRRRQAAAHVEC